MEKLDKMTGLYNKWGFYFKVQEILEQEKNAKDKNYQIVCTDINHFKLINDLFGMNAGDDLIKKMGLYLKKISTSECIVARLESDKFAFFAPQIYAEKMRKKLLNHFFQVDQNGSYKIHLCLGVYEIDNMSIPVSLMCDRAYIALRTIKENKQMQVAYFKETMREQMLKEQILYGELHRAIHNQEMTIHLQGIFDKNECLVGAETLVRWNHPTKGLLSAGAFVETLEQNGLIVELDQYVWELACQQLQKWEQEGKEELFLSVNISVKDFETLDVCEVLVKLTQKYQIDPKKLRLEITETALMTDIEKNIFVIEKLRNSGFIVEIDDFGSGYSSLNTLKDITADVVKLDMKFLQKSQNEKKSKIILTMMIELVKKLEMQVLVEGVETKEQLNFLKEYECDAFQGYYLMYPSQIEQFNHRINCSKEVAFGN